MLKPQAINLPARSQARTPVLGVRFAAILYEDSSETLFYSNHTVLKSLQDFAANKKSGYERESAAIAFHSFATILGVPAAPLLLSSLADPLRSSTWTRAKSFALLLPPP